MCMFILGEHLGADLPGVLSAGDDQHCSVHHYGKALSSRSFSHTKLNSFKFWPSRMEAKHTRESPSAGRVHVNANAI